MFDPEKEPPIRLADVPDLRWLPLRRAGTKLNVATVFRWAQRGCKGIKLETLNVGGAKYTSEASLKRFFEKLSDSAVASGEQRPAQQRAESISRANQILDRAGI